MVSHENKCIYVHIPKTAGSSIIELLKIEKNKKDKKQYQWPENKFRPPSAHHLRAIDYLNNNNVNGIHVTKKQFNEYFKFAFVRNPFDRIVSEYKFRHHPRKYDFKTFLFKQLPRGSWEDEYCHIIPQYDFIYDNKGNCLVDYVARFENLKTEFDSICKKIGLKKQSLPHINRSLSLFNLGIHTNNLERLERVLDILSHKYHKNTFKHYSEYYDNESREFVTFLYEKDLETFNYNFK